jgi:hypothetical protein
VEAMSSSLTKASNAGPSAPRAPITVDVSNTSRLYVC